MVGLDGTRKWLPHMNDYTQHIDLHKISGGEDNSFIPAQNGGSYNNNSHDRFQCGNCDVSASALYEASPACHSCHPQSIAIGTRTST